MHHANIAYKIIPLKHKIYRRQIPGKGVFGVPDTHPPHYPPALPLQETESECRIKPRKILTGTRLCSRMEQPRAK